MAANLYVYPSIARLWARVDGLIHSFNISWSCGSCIWLFTVILRFSCSQISITVNVKCHCQQNPANQLPRTTGNIGRSWCKSSIEVWFGPGFQKVQWWRFNGCHMGIQSNVDSTAKNRALSFVWWSHIFDVLKCEQAFVFTWLHFFYYLHLLYKRLQAPSPYTVNKVLKE